jgi:hypothetical protein
MEQTLAQQVIETLKSVGIPGMMISGEKPLQRLNALLERAQKEVAKEAVYQD